MPRARAYTKRIELHRSTKSADGFGGNTMTTAKVADLWAKLETLDKMKFRQTDLGTLDLANSVQVTVRDNPNISINYKTDFIIYRSENYFISDRPLITNFEDNYITFIMTRQND